MIRPSHRALVRVASAFAAVSCVSSVSFGSDFATTGCFSRDVSGVCSEIVYDRLSDTISESFALSDVSQVGSMVDGHLAVDSFGFTPPPAGLQGFDPNDGVAWFSSTTPLHDLGVPTDTFTYEHRGNAVVSAVRPEGSPSEAQTAIWGGRIDDGIEFFGGAPEDTEVEVKLSYTATATLGVPMGAADVSASGAVDLSGGFTISNPADPFNDQILNYNGTVIFDPSSDTFGFGEMVTVLEEWDPATDSEQDDMVELDAPMRHVLIDIHDEISFMANTGMTYDIDAFFSGGGFVSLFIDGGTITNDDGLEWFSSSQNTFIATLQLLTPGGTLVVGNPIPEPGAFGLAAFAAGCLTTLSRRRRLGRPPGACSAAGGSAPRAGSPAATPRRRAPTGSTCSPERSLGRPAA